MKGTPAYLMALGVVVAAAFVYTVAAKRGPASGKELASLRDSVESLRKDVAELRIALNEVEAASREGRAATSEQAIRPTTGGAPETGVAPETGGVETGGGASVEATGGAGPTEGDEVNTEPVDIVLEVAADHTITLDGRVVAKDDLEAELKRLLQANPAMQLIVKADASVPFDEVVEVGNTAKRVGIRRLSLGTEPAE